MCFDSDSGEASSEAVDVCAVTCDLFRTASAEISSAGVATIKGGIVVPSFPLFCESLGVGDAGFPFSDMTLDISLGQKVHSLVKSHSRARAELRSNER